MRRLLLCIAVVGAALSSCTPRSGLTPEEARVIARDAYVYGFPLVDNYRIQHAYYVDTANPEFKGAWNEIHSMARVYTPEDRAVQTPNSDTPYGVLGVDLRAEPLVITLPAIEKSRYYSAQFIDLYTHNFAYAGSRTTGNEGGSFLLAGPGWSGETPPGVREVFHSETRLAGVIFRTQLFNPGDLEAVKKIQAGYKVQPLSQFLGQAPPAAAPAVEWMKPLSAEDERTSPEFFNVLNFVLQFCPTHPSEIALMERFARLGIGDGKVFDAARLDASTREAVLAGMRDAWAVADSMQAEMAAGRLTSGEVFGTREFLKNDYARRMVAAVAGIYGNSAEEARYPAYAVDAAGDKLSGAHRYRLRFGKGQMPPVNAFWSLTMYEMPASLLYANPLDRYLINSPMLPQLERDADGGFTLYIQHETPGAAKESNWLPAPAGEFRMALRLYWPKPEAAAWKQPPLEKLD